MHIKIQGQSSRWSYWLARISLVLIVSACGGGGGGSSSGSGAGGVVVGYPASLATLSDVNVMPISVAAGPGRNANMPYVTVTVCVPGTNQCKNIDNVLLDTGSTGLRLFADQLAAAPSLALPAHRINGSSTISECAQFLSMVAWGKVHVADVVLGGERANALPIQLMDYGFASMPSISGGSPMVAGSSGTNLQALRANGILGVGLFTNDAQLYFNCASPSNSCRFTPQNNQQVQNPVSFFAMDNNGLAIQLPSLPAQGAVQAQGYLIFGVNTRINNQLASANVIPTNPLTGYFTTVYRGVSVPNSFIDSGSNGLFFNDSAVFPGSCSQTAIGFYCPGSNQHLSASVPLALNTASIAFDIDNAQQLFATGTNLAFSNLGGPTSNSFFDWGLPFFFGRTVFTIVEGNNVNTQSGVITGPFYAFTN